MPVPGFLYSFERCFSLKAVGDIPSYFENVAEK